MTAPARECLVVLIDGAPAAHAWIDGWTFWFCHGCNHIDHFETVLSEEQLRRYTRGHRLFCADDTEPNGATT